MVTPANLEVDLGINNRHDTAIQRPYVRETANGLVTFEWLQVPELVYNAVLIAFSTHSLVDELLWLKASIVLQEGLFEEAIELLSTIHEQYFNDILGDDAYYRMGVIYEENIQDKAKAMEIFRDFLVTYPGSIYSTDSRKRFRTLRGDFDNFNNDEVN